MKSGYDWFFPTIATARCARPGRDAYEMLLQGVGAADDPVPAAAKCPALGLQAAERGHAILLHRHQILHAVGCAEATRWTLHPDATQKSPAITVRSKTWSFTAMVTRLPAPPAKANSGSDERRSNLRLPVFLVEDNGYAISVPVEVRPGGNISRLVSIPNFHFEEIDGTDPVVSYGAMARAVAHCRAGIGPSFIHAHVIRPYSHSLSDDEKLYRPDIERQRDAARDPISRMQMFLIREGILDEKGINELEKEVDDGLQAAVDQVLAAQLPAPETVKQYLYSPDLDPTSAAFDTRAAQSSGAASTDGDARTSTEQAAHEKKHAPKTMADLINTTLRDEMKRDERIVMFGEDVADCSREEYLRQKMVKGKGGVFKLTAGLQSEFGSDRVFNSPIAEASIVGRAVGLAVRGLKPVVEIQFFDYIWPAMMQLRNELPVMRWRSNGTFSAPCVIRVAIGGYLTGGPSIILNAASIFTHTPGMRVVFPYPTRWMLPGCCEPRSAVMTLSS